MKKTSRDFSSDDVEQLIDYVNSCYISDELIKCEYPIETAGDSVNVAIVHDGSGFTPRACICVEQDRDPDSALRNAFEDLEEFVVEHYWSEPDRVKEREESIEEGFDIATETFDGMVFTVSPQELEEALKKFEGRAGETLRSIVEFEYPEEEDEEDDLEE